MSYSLNSRVIALKDLHLEGNIIPMEWFAHLKFASGKPDMNAILILSDIVYWYRPVVVRNEQTGMVTGYRKKFKSDLLQKSYQHYADLFGLSKRQVSDAIIRLEERGLIKRVLRTLETPSMTLQNILFIALNVQKLLEINTSVGGVPIERETSPDRKGYLPRSIGTPPPIEDDTYTENTTKTPTEITTHANAHEEFPQQMLDVWNQGLCPSVPVQLTPSRQVRLRAILQQYFQGNIEQWRSFCQEIIQSPFLMGQGQRRWRVTLDWILEPHNLQKTLEGNYRNLLSPALSDVSLSPEESVQKAQHHIKVLSDPELQQFARNLLHFISPETYLRWFVDLQMENTSDQKITLQFPCRATRDYVERRYSSEVGVAVHAVYPAIKWIEYKVIPPSATGTENSPTSEFLSSYSPQEGGKGELPCKAHPPSQDEPAIVSLDEASCPPSPAEDRKTPSHPKPTNLHFLPQRTSL